MHEIAATLEARRDDIGTESVTDWIVVDQTSVDAFGAVTGNLDPMHNDPDWVKETGVWGGRTVLHGLYGASLIPRFLKMLPQTVMYSTDRMHSVNYGFENLRWTSPMYVGVPLRARVSLLDISEKSEGRYLMKYKIVLEQQGSEKPCMVATSLVMIVCT
jgi:acyl dehydratase